MPIDTNGRYVAPTWVDDNEPAIDADELNAMSGAIQGAVEYDRAMNLTSTQKERARNNIGVPYIYVGQASLLSSNWSGSSAPYTQTVTNSNIQSGSYIILKNICSTESNYDQFENAKLIVSAINNGSFTLSAIGEKPTLILSLQYVAIKTV